MESSLRFDHPPQTRHFCKIIISKIGPNSTLMIPGEFARKYRDELDGRVLLKAPGGSTWPVDLERNDKGEVWLKNGWPEFANFHSLCFGHFLLFEYLGSCNFQVLIFDKGATEIDYPVANSSVEQAKQCEIEKRSALALVQAFKSNNPSFTLTMQRSYLTGHAHVKKVYLESYLTSENGGPIILKVGGRTWPINCTVYVNRCRLGQGWINFVRENSIGEGDVCVFELVDPGNKLVNVVIVRAEEKNRQ